MNLAGVFAGLTRDEAKACYDALAQWADNERNGLGESEDPDGKHEKRVELVEAVVERLELEITKLANLDTR